MSTYQIRRGDTLSRLAQRFGTSVQALATTNNIKNPNLIIAGRSLQIPDGFDRPSGSGSAPRTGGTGHAGHDHDHPVSGTTSSTTSASGDIHAGRGWGGSEGVADVAKAIARDLGIPITSQKRDAAQTRRLDSNFGSDHFTGNENAFAVDFGVAGQRGDELARAIARKYGIPESNIGTYNRHIINVDGQRYSLQLLWKVEGHYNHVHFGIRRA
ncbi:MAG TPA: LysM domain-containing protein [Myxococcaceae bacterium]|jgi:murein DD-endopeptidase MepM/ murein hydrolase activator NlpD